MCTLVCVRRYSVTNGLLKEKITNCHRWKCIMVYSSSDNIDVSLFTLLMKITYLKCINMKLHIQNQKLKSYTCKVIQNDFIPTCGWWGPSSHYNSIYNSLPNRNILLHISEIYELESYKKCTWIYWISSGSG